MDTQSSCELDRRTLLKGGVVGAGAIALAGARDAGAQDRDAVKDTGLVTEMVTFKSGPDTINAFVARPKKTGRFGTVIVVPDIRGLSEYIKETTAQIAQAGLAALAFDFYSRQGGAPETDDFAVIREFVTKNAPDRQILADGLAALEYAKKQPYSSGKFGVTGFCMGGRVTLLLAAHAPEIVAASPYYGPVRAGSPVQIAPMEHVEKIRAAVQGHYGANDRNPTPDDVRAFYEELKQTNSQAEYFIYEGAGHAFHSFGRPSFNPDAASKAWARTLEFFRRHLSAGA